MVKIGSGALSTLILLFSLFTGLKVEAKDEVIATINGQANGEVQIVMGQSFLYSIIVSSSESGGVGEPRLPDISGFNLVDRGSQVESRSEFVNGKFSFVRRQIFNYRLVPQAPGEFTITPAEVVVGQNTLRSNSINLKVMKSAGNVRPSQPQAPQPNYGEDDAQDAMDEADAIFSQLLQRTIPKAQQAPSNINPDEAFFIRVEVDKQKVYAGEQITATWYLYTQNNLTNFEPMKYPDLKSFWKEDIEIATRLNFTNVVINGLPYKKALLVSYALFPIKPGTATIDSYKLRATAIMSSAFGVFGKPYTFTKVNPPVKIEVLPVPSQGQPTDYSGAVGTFDIKGSVDKTTVAANEPFTFKVRFEGKGNAKQIEIPALNLPEGFEQYDTKSDSKFSTDGSSFKEFEILLIPRKTGELTIPGLSVSFFNPNTRQFEKRTTQPIPLKVVAGKNQLPSGGDQGFMTQSQEKVKITLPNLVYKESSFTMTQEMWNKIWMIVTVLTALALMGLYIKEIRVGEKRIVLVQEMSKRMNGVSKLQSDKKFREAGVSVVNLVDFLLSEMTMDQDTHQIDQLIEKLPPSVLRVLDDKFRQSLKYFETLGFAPEEIVGPIANDKRFKEEIKSLKGYLTRAIEIYQKNS
ncbi:MAG: BatD family protein [Bdellovibrionota bacterium]